MLFFYGNGHTYLDVTNVVLNYCFDDNRIYVPPDDGVRANIFPDPLWGVEKKVIVMRKENGISTCREYDSESEILIWPTREEREAIAAATGIAPGQRRPRSIVPVPPLLTTDEKIAFLHSQLKFSGGRLNDEYAEQAMVVNFLDPDAKVLELGSNIGRNTMVIACLLNDDRNLVTLECDPISVEILRNNRFANGFDFHIEPSALSYKKLIQKSWATVPSDVLLEGYSWVNTITFEQLTKKYATEFDTLVADCEGALFYILEDNPEVLRNITTVILESDYLDANHKHAVEDIFARYGLEKIFHLPVGSGWPAGLPDECMRSFYEVWQGGTKRYLPRSGSTIPISM